MAMAAFEDGSYSCIPGITLIAKVMAGRCQMRYTRAAVGKGMIPEDGSPKTMAEPADYVMDAKISDVTNPVDGECQVTVQINSDDVEHGFFATGILLYAQDPDLGEVPYTYLLLESGPEWIRPSSASVGKLATFDLIAAVGDVDNVTADIDPESFVTHKMAQKLIEEHDNAPDAHQDIRQIIPEFSVDGKTLVISRGVWGGGTGGGGGSAYILPAATERRLGGVKIGDGIDVTTDGTISTDVTAIAEAAAAAVEENTEEYTADEIQALFHGA